MSTNGEFNMAQAIIDRLGGQIADLVVQLAAKDAQIEMLQQASVEAQPKENHEARSPAGQ